MPVKRLEILIILVKVSNNCSSGSALDITYTIIHITYIHFHPFRKWASTYSMEGYACLCEKYEKCTYVIYALHKKTQNSVFHLLYLRSHKLHTQSKAFMKWYFDEEEEFHLPYTTVYIISGWKEFSFHLLIDGAYMCIVHLHNDIMLCRVLFKSTSASESQYRLRDGLGANVCIIFALCW